MNRVQKCQWNRILHTSRSCIHQYHFGHFSFRSCPGSLSFKRKTRRKKTDLFYECAWEFFSFMCTCTACTHRLRQWVWGVYHRGGVNSSIVYLWNLNARLSHRMHTIGFRFFCFAFRRLLVALTKCRIVKVARLLTVCIDPTANFFLCDRKQHEAKTKSNLHACAIFMRWFSDWHFRFECTTYGHRVDARRAVPAVKPPRPSN